VRSAPPKTSHAGASSSRRARRPGEPSAADQPAVEADRVGPVERHRLLGRAVRGERVGERVHPGEEDPPRLGEGLLRFQHDRELGDVEAPTQTSVPAPASPAIALACAKASPASRSATGRYGGGRSRVSLIGRRGTKPRGLYYRARAG
jgi:hypothetical protein